MILSSSLIAESHLDGSGRVVFTGNPIGTPANTCSVVRPEGTQASPESAPFSKASNAQPGRRWFCTMIPSIFDQDCYGQDDVIPRDELFYSFTDRPFIGTFPTPAIFLKEDRFPRTDGEGKKAGYILPDQAVQRITKLHLRINGQHIFEFPAPFAVGTGITPDFIKPGYLAPQQRGVVLNELLKYNLDVSRVKSIELVGFYARPLELSTH